ncbi:hypothetical protein BDP55DRAFT_629064 [Colletotrichum godetiae]|uniref:Uncharacterized protein n=1 Tax=Colletotrichum godetiae TaxID=1209918 RepID=A0AAJ0ARJ7_9PEZI|nr:uncharacterized protein BDP55DRAFT_629064 [Colletotrichum godetiae]KAK1689073.1 hypothetical protein BDP55DRAFT_629064 [Colletotrichum godetiae]
MPTPVSLGRVRLAGIIDIRHDGSPLITEQFGQSDERIWGRSNHPKLAKNRIDALCACSPSTSPDGGYICVRERGPGHKTRFVLEVRAAETLAHPALGCAAFMLGSGSRVWLDVAERPWASANSPRPAVTVQRRFRAHPYQSTELGQGCILLFLPGFLVG